MPSPPILSLDDPAAADAARTGAKAANLAHCRAAGMPVLDGFALTTDAVAAGTADAGIASALREAWSRLGGDRDRPLVVRSSSTIEDAGSSSMAGQFTSVLDVVGWESFTAAVKEVVASADRVRDAGGTPRPIAVLVQPQLEAAAGGVLFGVDPVTGDRTRLMVEVVGSRPDELVGGQTTAAQYVLSRRGRIVDSARTDVAPPLGPALRRELAGVARRAEEHFGSPQDVEWAVDGDGRLWVLQSRPVTAVATGPGTGALLGPGPVAETFPLPLSRLEADLWVEPLREGIVAALSLTGAASAREIRSSPVVVTVGGWAAVDLELLGVAGRGRSFWRKISPAALVRHLAVAWRVGRLRIALPSLAATMSHTVDDHLSAIGDLEAMDLAQLVDLVERVREELATVHRWEVLSGILLGDEPRAVPAPVVALAALARERARGLDDDAIIAAEPVVLALSPPTLGDPGPLPPTRSSGWPRGDVEDLGTRDALRLRTRWLQELAGRATRLAVERLVAEGRLADGRRALELGWRELAGIAQGAPPPGDLESRAAVAPGPPLPPSFRLSDAGEVVAERSGGSGSVDGIAVGGGRAEGVTRNHVSAGSPRRGAVLVTRHLEPQLAPVLPSLEGLVSETGSALSHLAILAREMGVATVVGVPDARRRFPPGTRVVIDGGAGTIEVVEPAPDAAGPGGERTGGADEAATDPAAEVRTAGGSRGDEAR